MSLESPLLSASQHNSDKMELLEAGSNHRTTLGQTSVNPRMSNARFYATNHPKIMLETITARTTVLMLLITYVCFILCEVIDFHTLQQSFSTNSLFDLGSLPCGASGASPSSETYGCLSNGNTTWSGTVLDLKNVISVQLTFRRSNASSYLETRSRNASSVIDVTYNLNLWACYDEQGCGHNFASSLSSLAAGAWHSVLALSNQPSYASTVTLNPPDQIISYDSQITFPVINTTFQNQESVPTNGIVKSYYVSVQYLSLSPDASALIQPSTISPVDYQFLILRRPSTYLSTIATIVLMVLTILLAAAYIAIVLKYQRNKWLSEQRWIVIYFAALIMYQNPIYSAITLNASESTAPAAAYASYVLDNAGQATFLVLWLCFADSVHNKASTSKTGFYLPKLTFGLIFFTVTIVVLTYQFPDLSQAFLQSSGRSPVEAVANWPQEVKDTFCTFSLMFLLLFWIWALWWFVTLYRARRALSRLPYMNTRYLQLSYRFFLLQATLVTVYYVSQYGFVIYILSPGGDGGVTGLTDNINTLFRQQTQLFGKVLFLTVYAFSLAFLFLPAGFMENKLATALRATYVVTEDERQEVVAKRKSTIRSLNKVMLINNLVIKAKPEVFCVDRALALHDVAFEAYYDPPGMPTDGLGKMDLGRHGYELVDALVEKATFVVIARHRESRRLCIAFRGTVFKTIAHWKTNFKYGMKDVDILALSLDKLDAIDDLDVDAAEVERERHNTELGAPGGVGGGAGSSTKLGAWDEGDEDEEDDDALSRNPSLSMFGAGAGAGGGGYNNNNNSSGSKQESGPRFARSHTMRDTIYGGISAVGTTTKRAVGKIGDATEYLLGQSAGLVRSAAKHTPVLNGLVKPFVHSGFWDAYSNVREFVHAVVRRELKEEPSDIYLTGHSLGGALGTIAALDLAVHTLPRVNAYHLKLWNAKREGQHRAGGVARAADAPLGSYAAANMAGTDSLSSKSSASASSKKHLATSINDDRDVEQPPSGFGTAGATDSASNFPGSSNKKSSRAPPRLKASLYTFGAPKVGNGSFTYLVNKWVSDSFRVVVDGDIVASLPPTAYTPTGYRHSGTEIVVDSRGRGSIIIDRSFVERWLRPSTSYSVKVHALLYYHKGILGVKKAAEYFTEHQGEHDFLHLAYRKDQNLAADRGPSFSQTQAAYAGDRDVDPIPPRTAAAVPSPYSPPLSVIPSSPRLQLSTQDPAFQSAQSSPRAEGGAGSSRSNSLSVSVGVGVSGSSTPQSMESTWFSTKSTPLGGATPASPSPSTKAPHSWITYEDRVQGLSSKLDERSSSLRSMASTTAAMSANPLHSSAVVGDTQASGDAFIDAVHGQGEGEGEGEGDGEEEEVAEEPAQGVRGFLSKNVLPWFGWSAPIDMASVAGELVRDNPFPEPRSERANERVRE